MKKILVALFMFCQFSFFVEALDYFEEFEEAIETLDKLDEVDEVEDFEEFEEAIETLDKLDKLDEVEDFDRTDEVEEFEEAIETLDKLDEVDRTDETIETLDKLDEVDEVDRTDETSKSKSFYEIEYDNLFFEMGILYNLYNKDDVKAILGMGVETKYKNSYIIFQNCIDLVYLASTKNNVDFTYIDFVWTPTFFLGNSIIKIGVGTPLGIGGYIYGGNLSSFISIGARFSIKLTIGYISLETYYQVIESNEFGLTLKISMGRTDRYNWIISLLLFRINLGVAHGTKSKRI